MSEAKGGGSLSPLAYPAACRAPTPFATQGLLPPINLNLEEALALVLLASELGKTGRLPFFQPARDAAAKIESTLPLGLRATLGSLVRHMAARMLRLYKAG